MAKLKIGFTPQNGTEVLYADLDDKYRGALKDNEQLLEKLNLVRSEIKVLCQTLEESMDEHNKLKDENNVLKEKLRDCMNKYNKLEDDVKKSSRIPSSDELSESYAFNGDGEKSRLRLDLEQYQIKYIRLKEYNEDVKRNITEILSMINEDVLPDVATRLIIENRLKTLISDNRYGDSSCSIRKSFLPSRSSGMSAFRQSQLK